MSINDQQLLQTMQEVGDLLFRRLKNELTVHEQIILDNWLNEQDPSSKQFFEDCSDWKRLQGALQTVYSFDEEAALADLQKKINFEFQTSAPVIEISKSKNKNRFYWAAAAVLMLVAGAAVVFNLNSKKVDISKIPLKQRYKNDVSPGGDKAVLQLADGRKVVLDNASNGELAKQGSTKVIKLDNGQLAYQAGKAGTAQVNYNTISTPKGGQYQVILPDGSKVWLNAASSLRFPTAFSGTERKVELSGEAYFQISKNANMPFRVAVVQPTNASSEHDPMEIEVLGTEFNLTAYADEDIEKATLVNGGIKVISDVNQKILKPGEQARLGKEYLSINLIPAIDLEQTIAWKNEVIQFHDASIESIMRQAARWYDIDVSYAGKVNQQFIGKVSQKVNLSTLLKILEATGWVHFRIDGKKVTVYP